MSVGPRTDDACGPGNHHASIPASVGENGHERNWRVTEPLLGDTDTDRTVTGRHSSDRSVGFDGTATQFRPAEPVTSATRAESEAA